MNQVASSKSERVGAMPWCPLAALAFFLAAGALRAETPLIGFLSDFGLENEAVAVCKGVMLGLAPDARLVDITHNVPAFDTWEGSIILRETAIFPRGTIFVAVIDPGVGSARQAIAVRTGKGHFYIAPNNGLLTWVLREQGIATVVAIDPLKVNPNWKPGTFDGRDLFSPAAALLARSGGDLASLGDPLPEEKLVRFEIPEVTVSEGRVSGIVERNDKPYGNALTTIGAAHLTAAGISPGNRVRVSIAGRAPLALPFVKTFSDVAEGEPLAYLDARDRLAFAVNLGNFCAANGVAVRAPVVVEAVRTGESLPAAQEVPGSPVAESSSR